MICTLCKQTMRPGTSDGKPVSVCLTCGVVLQLPMGGPTTQHRPASRARSVATEHVRSKYGNVKTECDGIKFDSKREADRYIDLKILQNAGAITGLQLQPSFDLIVNGIKVARYVGDFMYVDGCTVVEDVKGMKTTAYRLKKRLMLAIHGIEIKEIM